MVRLYVLLFVAEIVLTVIALISCLSAEPGQLRALPRPAWVLIILFVPLLGAIAYLLTGRPVPAGHPGGDPTARNRLRQVAPDDDPEFLRSLGGEQARNDRERIEQWERDLRRREDEIRRREAGDPPQENNQPET